MTRQRAFGHHDVRRRAAPKKTLVWLAMRQLLRFEIAELAMTTGVPYATARDFAYGLARVGYLRSQRVGRGELTGGSKYVYQLVRNTGPKPPVVRAADVYDPNEDRAYTSADKPWPEVNGA